MLYHPSHLPVGSARQTAECPAVHTLHSRKQCHNSADLHVHPAPLVRCNPTGSHTGCQPARHHSLLTVVAGSTAVCLHESLQTRQSTWWSHLLAPVKAQW